MKQVFDWLREHLEETANDVSPNTDKLVVLARVERLINEAEAKWESDCCIRVVGKPFTSSCGQKYDKWTYVGEPYCSKCGKKIKISEVE